MKDGVSLGNKTHYHHHGVWFARHGYVCLIIDTVQWGEILGEHHGTYRLGRWWWPARGYTPAGVETWNAIRALDYLESRPEVDATRIGVTGRSGGGAYSWWVAALDDRVKVAAPTAGITTLRNHVLDGCIEGHCDCMFMQNTHRWDFDRVAALVAPRPLLILNTDKDDIFPIEGVYSIYRNTRRLYKTLGAEKNIGLQVAEGPHKDTQALNTGAFAWFERFLKGADPMATFDEAAKPALAPESLRVFDSIPRDERTTTIDRDFVPAAPTPPMPDSAEQWTLLRDGWMRELREKVFSRWPAEKRPLSPALIGESKIDGWRLDHYRFVSDPVWPCEFWLARPADAIARTAGRVTLEIGGDNNPEAVNARFDRHRAKEPDNLWALFAPRGVGSGAWSGDERKQNQIRRRFWLLGETLEGQQAWDIRRAIQALRQVLLTPDASVEIIAQADLAPQALYASLFEPGIARLVLDGLPESHGTGPCFLNVLKYLDVPQSVAMAAERSAIVLRSAHPEAWAFATATAKRLNWTHGITITPNVIQENGEK
jgi:dienelactone hydrolase